MVETEITKVGKPDDRCKIIDIRSIGRNKLEEEPIPVKPNLQKRMISYISKIADRHEWIVIYGITAIVYGSFLGISYHDRIERERANLENYKDIYYNTAEVYGDRPMIDTKLKKSNLSLLVETYSGLDQTRHFMMPGENRESVCKSRLKGANKYNAQRLEACLRVVEKNNKDRSRILLFPEFKNKK